MTGEALAVDRVGFTTRNRDEAAEFVRRTYFDNRLRVVGGEASGAYATNRVTVETEIAGGRVQCAFGFTLDAPPIDYVAVGLVQRGTLQQVSGDEDLHRRSGEVFLIPPSAPTTITVSRLAMLGLRIPLAVAQDVAAAQANVDPRGLRFHSGRPVSTAMARYWRSTVTLITDELNATNPVFTHPLVTEQTQRQLAATLLTAFPNTTMTVDQHAHFGSVAPAAVRRAAAYIEAHASHPIRLANIAEAAGTRPRTLQHAFKRHYGTTPVGYLTRVRLEGAHRDLQAADPTRGATVAAIARRWGFASPSRFGVIYRTSYGHPPGHTLRT